AGPSRSRPPLCMGALATVGRPLQGAWPQPAAPLQVTDRPCKGAGRGHARLPLVKASFATKIQQERENLGSDTTVGKPTVGASHVQRKSK
ncbi:hypothetical protein B296_00032015, partial [Ensete ventricosum]